MKRALFLILTIGIFLLSACSASAPTQAPAQLLLSWSYHTENGYTNVIGEVKNISDSELDNVLVVVAFRTKTGFLVKTENALLDNHDLSPDQVSLFEVTIVEDPNIETCTLSFFTSKYGHVTELVTRER